MRFFAAILVLVIVASGQAMGESPSESPTSVVTDTSDDMEHLGYLLRRLQDHLASKQNEAAYDDLEQIFQMKTFDAVDRAFKANLYTVTAAIEVELKMPQEALEHLRMSNEELPEGRDYSYWSTLFSASWQLRDYGQVVESVTQIARVYPDALVGWDDVTVARVIMAGLQLPSGDHRGYDLLEALWEMSYEPANGYPVAEGTWRPLLIYYASLNQDEKARQLASALVTPTSIIALSVDSRLKRFAPTDVEQAFVLAQAKSVDDAKRLVETHPRDIRAADALATALLYSNRPEEALSVVDSVLAKLAGSDLPSLLYDDADLYLPWLRNSRTQILLALGRFDQALDEQVASYNASGDDAVSQKVNLAGTYVSMDRPKEAIDLLDTLDLSEASPYGQMAAESVRACAYHGLEDTREAASLRYLKDNVQYGVAALRMALICSQDRDALAKMMIDELDDPQQRSDALVNVQTYLDRPFTQTEKAQSDLLREVSERPDVAATIERFGAIRSWPTLGPN